MTVRPSPVTNQRGRPADAARLTPRARLERLAQLQRRARELLMASEDGARHFWARNLRKRRIHAAF